MKKLNYLVHLSAFFPRKDGIGTYTVALDKTLKNQVPDLKTHVVAVNNYPAKYRYSRIVKFEIDDTKPRDYQEAANWVNQSGAEIIDLQHEFGLFGAQVNPDTLGQHDGKNILEFLRTVKIPVVTTLHMVYSNPPGHHKELVLEIFRLSTALVVLTEYARELLIKDYGLKREEVIVIPHGVPNVPKYSTSFFKEMLGINRKDLVISSYGLIRPKKGYEYLIRAMPQVLKKYPQALLLIVGDVHPQRDPAYYDFLKKEAKRVKVYQRVRFIKKFLDYTDLLNYLMATNIFVAPFLVMQHISSGTLSYAMATGRASIATPFDFAREYLAEGRGVIVPPRNSQALANKIVWLLKHPKARHLIEMKSYRYVRDYIWSKTAKRYLQVFEKILNERK